ncbi:TPA: hypothetical protein ACF1UY_002785 [Enterococcus hirae]
MDTLRQAQLNYLAQPQPVAAVQTPVNNQANLTPSPQRSFNGWMVGCIASLRTTGRNDLLYCVQAFMYELFETPQYMQRNGIIQLEYDSYASKYFICGKSRDENALTTNKYGTKRANAYLILENSLNLLKVEVRDRVIDDDGKKRYELNPKETMYARMKQEELQETFKSWVMNHSEVLEELHAIYEERFNRIVPRTYDGSQLEFPGLNQKITLRPAQQNVVARILHEGRALMAHSVGAGKTLSMITAGMMMKEHGLIKKAIPVFFI